VHLIAEALAFRKYCLQWSGSARHRSLSVNTGWKIVLYWNGALRLQCHGIGEVLLANATFMMELGKTRSLYASFRTFRAALRVYPLSL